MNPTTQIQMKKIEDLGDTDKGIKPQPAETEDNTDSLDVEQNKTPGARLLEDGSRRKLEDDSIRLIEQ